MSAGHLWDLPKGKGMATRYQGKQVAESPPVKVQEKQREYQKNNSEIINEQNHLRSKEWPKQNNK